MEKLFLLDCIYPALAQWLYDNNKDYKAIAARIKEEQSSVRKFFKGEPTENEDIIRLKILKLTNLPYNIAFSKTWGKPLPEETVNPIGKMDPRNYGYSAHFCPICDEMVGCWFFVEDAATYYETEDRCPQCGVKLDYTDTF